MGLWSRIANIGKAKATRIVEAQEKKDPVGILKTNLAEAQKNLKEFESAVHSMLADKKKAQSDVEQAKQDIKDWGAKAKLALEQGNEELARKALERQTEKEQELESLKTYLTTATRNAENAKAKYQKTLTTIEESKRKISTLEARQKAANAAKKNRETLSKYEGNGNPLDQITMFEDKVAELERENEAADELTEEVEGEDINSQFDDLKTSSSVEDKLAKLKAKVEA